MNGLFYTQNHSGIATLACRGTGTILGSARDVITLLEAASHFDTNLVLLRETHFSPEFYHLSTGLAGDILQKFSNYALRVAIVGTFSSVQSERFRELMRESNKGSQVLFATDEKQALVWLTGQIRDPGPR